MPSTTKTALGSQVTDTDQPISDCCSTIPARDGPVSARDTEISASLDNAWSGCKGSFAARTTFEAGFSKVFDSRPRD